MPLYEIRFTLEKWQKVTIFADNEKQAVNFFHNGEHANPITYGAEIQEQIDVLELPENSALDLETHRQFWAEIAKKHGWFSEPFYVQVWVEPDTGVIWDAVSTQGMTQDIVVYESREA